MFTMIVIFLFGSLLTSCTVSVEGKVNALSDEISSELELNKDQKRSLEVIAASIITDLRERKTYSFARNPMVDQFFMAEKLDRSTVDAAVMMRNKAFESKVDQYFPMFEELHSTLTPVQKQKLSKISMDIYKRFRKIL